MDITKVHTSGNDIRVDVGFTKIDEERREVSGFATTGKVDAHGEIVDPDGSLEAFKNFRGSIREMHQNNAVGVLAKFSDAQVFDSEDGQFYRGVMVSAKISKGAQDTWEKILDGTLKGFSIGGTIKERGFTMVDGKKVPVIKKYDLMELSVVDSPSNDASTFMSIFKTEDNSRVQPYKIYYQKETGNVVLSDEDDMEGFEQIGWTGDPDEVDVEEITSTKSEPVAKQGSTREIEEALRDLLLEENDVGVGEFVYIVDFDESEGWTVYETEDGKFKVDTNFENGVAFTGEPAEVRVEYNYIERNQGADMGTETTEKEEPATNKEGNVVDSEAVADTEEAVADDHADEVADDADTEETDDTEDETAKSEDTEDEQETVKSEDDEADDDEVTKSEDDEQETVKSEDDTEDEETTKSKDTAKSVNGELLDAVAALIKSVESMTETVEEVKENSTDTSEQIEDIAERVAAIEKSGAIKKSNESNTDVNDEDENFWKGSALSEIRNFVNN